MQQTLVEKTYKELRRKILRGELPPGTKLVTRTLAAGAGISLAPVREALRQLATEGLVEHIPDASTFVRKLSRKDVEELYVLREALESCAAAEAARNITERQLEELEAICQEAAQITEQIGRQEKQLATDKQMDRWLDNEEQFHTLLIEAARNRMLKKVTTDHRALSQVFAAQRHQPGILTLAVAEETCATHASLVDALRLRDANLAHQRMSAHIRRGRQTVMEYFRSHRQNEE